MIIFIIPSGLAAQQQEERDSVKLNGKYFLNYFKDGWTLFFSPRHWQEKDWTNFAVTGATAFNFYIFDEDIVDWVMDERSDGSNTISDIVEPLGRASALMPYSILFGTYGIGAIIKDYRLKKSSLLALESFAISGFFTQAIKFAVNRERPDGGKRAFSSGHTAAVWSVAAVFAYEYKDKKWVAPVMYTLATLTSLSRINDLRHWPSDVVIGFGLGYFTGRYISRIHDHRPSRNNDFSMTPMLGDGFKGLSLVYRFK